MFPSPYGEVGFNRMKWKWLCLSCCWFPSPYGEVGFNLRRNDTDAIKVTIKFPSPYGEVGFNLTQEGKTCKKIHLAFPSPYGEVGFNPCRLNSLFFATCNDFCGADGEGWCFSASLRGRNALESLLHKTRCGFRINEAWTIFTN